MNHLTNFYKNKCEQLQEQVINLQKLLNEVAAPPTPPTPIDHTNDPTVIGDRWKPGATPLDFDTDPVHQELFDQFFNKEWQQALKERILRLLRTKYAPNEPPAEAVEQWYSKIWQRILELWKKGMLPQDIDRQLIGTLPTTIWGGFYRPNRV
jgi:hypothetical protein